MIGMSLTRRMKALLSSSFFLVLLWLLPARNCWLMRALKSMVGFLWFVVWIQAGVQCAVDVSILRCGGVV